jgi:hypothetical protein
MNITLREICYLLLSFVPISPEYPCPPFSHHRVLIALQRRVRGVVVGWLPALGDDCALWHVQHSDGDVEDLELHEVGS